ncbi:MAG TPA: dihydrolipoyl dehydrogenase [Candidatus Hydrogenedentes bacterium]|jgi:dihydrolipoamide dehydrogenase|nr:MAG: Dihydrolipoyl dehydrogenase [Candidatus Hydrogenedentes bacterium ADurb.Bin170]HOD95989.1 dihydrolipoyl dehydrogenase [Candidatus Hydrogenedentota bacterium]HOR51494.1 dihydrolipoyl dehydrogenase [Candidatus Hydrogenedentota bacterium]HPK25376.1 dihydrolipoyl dehydrogenase [Candidatus Hydrogenedentota bacterium]HPX86881.1 dihydrolipoyl dehydrogenase [Candidatus Hydrogenedentota bacterium]
MKNYDVVVIGAGPGGYVAAIRAAQRGARTAVVEYRNLGGVCLNEGCIPTKTLIHTAELYRKLQNAAEFGIEVRDVRVNVRKMLDRKETVIGINTGGIGALFKANGIDLYKGKASIAEAGVVEVNGEKLTAKNTIIATGGRPAQLPGLEFDGTRVIGSTDALNLERIPESVVVIGAGALGTEFACIWNAFGAKVTLVEMMPTILPRSDSEPAKLLERILRKKKIDVRTGTRVEKIERKEDGVTVHFAGGKADSVDAEIVLVAIGLQCNSEIVANSPALNIPLGKRGGIPVNDRMESPVPGIYAIGDVIDRTWLAHGASAEGIVAATNCTGGNAVMDYRVLPACNFSSPELASVGLTEQEAKDQGYTVKTGSFLFAANGRAHTLGSAEGMVKIIGDAATDEILGVHILGPEAGEMIAVGALAMRVEGTVEEIASTIHTHPTLSEALWEAAEDYYGRGIHSKPKK